MTWHAHRQNDPRKRTKPHEIRICFVPFRVISWIVLLLTLSLARPREAPVAFNSRPPAQSSVTTAAQDEHFLEDLERRSFQYFWEQADPQTGLVPDRARMDGSPLPDSHRNVASIAATGFGLTALASPPRDVGLTPHKSASAPAIRCDSLQARPFKNAAGSIIGWIRRPANEDGTAKSPQSTRRCCWLES